jgi:hypothetical protein
MLGTNDAKAPAWKERKGDFVKDYTALVESYKILSSHPKVYIALSPPIYRKETGEGFSPANLEQVVGLTKKVAQETGADVIDVRAATSNHPDLFSDGVHPNEAGNAAIAKVVCEAITGKKVSEAIFPISSGHRDGDYLSADARGDGQGKGNMECSRARRCPRRPDER